MSVSDTSKAQLLDAAVRLLSSQAVVGVQKLLTPDALQDVSRGGDGEGISRHTAYRLWEDRGEAVVDIAQYVATTTTARGWAVAVAGIAEKIHVLWEVERSSGGTLADQTYETMRDTYRLMVADGFELQLSSEEMAAGWALQSAAFTSSGLWQGGTPGAELRGIGRRILSATAESRKMMVPYWAAATEGLLAWWGRRVRPGRSVEELVRVMGAMSDGLVLHLLADPDVYDRDGDGPLAAPIAFACDALFQVLWGFTEEVRLDPRRAAAEAGGWGDRFDALVDAALEAFAASGPGAGDVRRAAIRARVQPERVQAVFPRPADLADSGLRRLFAPAGIHLELAALMNPAPAIELVLRRLGRLAELYPGMLAAVRDDPEASVLDELTTAITAALASPTVHCPDPARLARIVLDLALGGAGGDGERVRSVLDVLQPPAP